MSTTTISAEPQHVTTEGKVHGRVSYTPEPGEPFPNDLHISYRRVSAFNREWITYEYIDVHPNPAITPFSNFPITPFDAPRETGAYDFRVQWTLDRHVIGERVGQFFVDPPTEPPE